jgi:hypothetical protein
MIVQNLYSTCTNHPPFTVNDLESVTAFWAASTEIGSEIFSINVKTVRVSMIGYTFQSHPL